MFCKCSNFFELVVGHLHKNFVGNVKNIIEIEKKCWEELKIMFDDN